jgi:hypothetical protein
MNPSGSVVGCYNPLMLSSDFPGPLGKLGSTLMWEMKGMEQHGPMRRACGTTVLYVGLRGGLQHRLGIVEKHSMKRKYKPDMKERGPTYLQTQPPIPVHKVCTMCHREYGKYSIDRLSGAYVGRGECMWVPEVCMPGRGACM